MPYSPVQLPFPLHFADMPKGELIRYFDWFIAIVPERVRELEQIIRSTPGFQHWSADKSVSSLGPLAIWFARNVASRTRGERELANIKETLRFPIAVNDWELTNHTFSLAFDVGVYLGETIRAEYPHITWTQVTKDKRDADYGNVVVGGLGPAPFNPIRVAIVFARGVADKTFAPNKLLEFYNFWAEQAAVHRP
jgi:hypothetical protein